MTPFQEAQALSVRGQVQQKYARRAAKLVNVFQCLIVSADAPRRRMLERAAIEGGWKTFPCSDAPTALAHVNRWLIHLAVIDLTGLKPEAIRPLVEQLAGCRGMLLVVCGHENNVEEEIWVRQHGAWMYLPGAADASHVGLLCGEARQIAERLAKPGERPSGQPQQSYS